MDQQEIKSIAAELVKQAKERLVVRVMIRVLERRGADFRLKVSVSIDLYTWCDDRLVQVSYRQIEGPWIQEKGIPLVITLGESEEDGQEAMHRNVGEWGSDSFLSKGWKKWAQPQSVVVVRMDTRDAFGENISPYNIRMVLHLMRFHAQLEGRYARLEERADVESFVEKKYLSIFLKRFGGLLNESFARLQDTLEI